MQAVLTITLDLNADTKADAHAAIGRIMSAFKMNDEVGPTFRLVDPCPSCDDDAPPPFDARTVDLDTDGLPHDARIHAPGKVRNADGRWRAKRNVDDATREKVTAELRAIMAASGTTGPAPAPVRDASNGPCNLGVGCDEAMGTPERCPHDPIPPPPSSPAVEAFRATIPPPPPPAAVTALFAPEAPAQGFGEFVDWLGDELSRGSVTDAMWQSVLRDLGLPGIAALDHRPDLVATARQRIEALRDAWGAP